MLSQLTDVAPKALLVGLGLWAAANWVFIGGEVGKRIVIADGHLAMCQSGYSQNTLALAAQAIATIPEPRLDPYKENAARQIRDTMNSPWAEVLNLPGMNFGASIEGTLSAYEHEKQLAVQTYETLVAAVRTRTEVRLTNVDDFCGCIVTEAISSAQNEFAILSGTFGFIRPSRVADLDGLMARTQASGACDHIAGRT